MNASKYSNTFIMFTCASSITNHGWGRFCSEKSLTVKTNQVISYNTEHRVIIHPFYITTLVTRVGKKILRYTFCPSSPLCNVDKTLSSNTSLHFTIFQHWKGQWGVDTCSVDITIIISCFWHFPTQFVEVVDTKSVQTNYALLFILLVSRKKQNIST